MITLAQYTSKMTTQGLKVFRYNTIFQSLDGAGEVIGLVYMMNPGLARPASDELFNKLNSEEYASDGLVETKPDETMRKVIDLIKRAYKQEGVKLPKRYVFHVENLFNIREKNGNIAQKLAKQLLEAKDVMFLNRNLGTNYKFTWFAWGQVSVCKDKQKSLLRQFPNAIKVLKRNGIGGVVQYVDYPVHPGRMKHDYFFEAVKGKIKV